MKTMIRQITSGDLKPLSKHDQVMVIINYYFPDKRNLANLMNLSLGSLKKYLSTPLSLNKKTLNKLNSLLEFNLYDQVVEPELYYLVLIKDITHSLKLLSNNEGLKTIELLIEHCKKLKDFKNERVLKRCIAILRIYMGNFEEGINLLNDLTIEAVSRNDMDMYVQCFSEIALFSLTVKRDYQYALEVIKSVNINPHFTYKAESLATYYYCEGIIYNRSGFLGDALVCFEKVLNTNGLSHNEYGKALLNIGLIKEKLCDYNVAIKHYNQSLIYYQKVRDYSGLITTYSNLASVYGKLDDAKLMKHYIDAGLSIKDLASEQDRYTIIEELISYQHLFNGIGVEKEVNEVIKYCTNGLVSDVEVIDRLIYLMSSKNIKKSELNHLLILLKSKGADMDTIHKVAGVYYMTAFGIEI